MSQNQNNDTIPVKLKRSQFLSYFEDTVKINTLLGVSFAGVCTVCLVLIFVLVKFSLTPKPIYYIPGANSAGYASPNEIPKSSVIGFVSSWLLSRTNFTPETIETVYTRAKRFMSPEFLSKSTNVLDKETNEIKKSSISSIFSLTEDPVFKEEDQGISITVNGEHSLYMGKTKIKSSNVKYVVSLQKTSPTELNPYGLFVKDVYKEETAKEEQK